MSKAEATRLADALENLKRNSFGQVQDMPVYEAAALLRQWPEHQSARIAELEAALKVAGEAQASLQQIKEAQR